MPNNEELYRVTHSSPEKKTVGDYVDAIDSPAYSYSGNYEAFLSIVGKDGLTNRQRIENNYHTPGDKKYKGYPAFNLPIKVGTLFYIDAEKINQISFVTQGIEVVSTDEPAFKAKKLAEIEADPRYIQVNKPINGQLQSGISKEYYPDMTVWIWCRSISDRGGETTDLKGRIFDLTPFIQKCTTNMGKNGGNFQITLPPIVCELINNKWQLSNKNLTQYINDNGTSVQGMGYVAEGSLFKSEESGDETLVRNQFLFHNIIGSNDLIFIRYETLDMEKEQRYEDSKQFIIDKKNLPNRIYDMIGLVDSNNQTVNPANNDVSINISGRDLSKLFIEDGTYFYALENSQGMLKFAGQSTLQSSLLNRIFGEGALNFIGLYTFTSIEHIFKFIIQQLSVIEVVPNDLFEAYGERRNKRFNETKGLTQTTDKLNLPKHEKKYTEELASGIWQIFKLVIDESVSKRRLADSGFSSANGSLLNFCRTAAQEPLVEMYFDTYSDVYNLIIRKPPYDRKALLTLIQGKVNTEDGTVTTPPAIINIKQEDVLQESFVFDDSQVYSWYHFYPRNAMINTSIDYSLSYLGALYFPEYAKIFGSKPFQQSNTYIPYVPVKNKGNTGSLDIYEMQAIEDLRYVVESSQYLPFTRKGMITLNGDRRLEVGNIFRFESTGEIGFIENVQQNFVISENSIDRTTTITVSRMMVEQLIYGIFLDSPDGDKRFVSYFNIINTELTFNNKEVTKTETQQVLTNTTQSTGGTVPLPGFGEYMQHQQGAKEAREIADAIRNGSNKVNATRQKNMLSNIGGDFGIQELNPTTFFNYWVKRYNKAYTAANNSISFYEPIYQSVAKDTSTPANILKAFGQIESGNRNIDSASGTYKGIMQIDSAIGKQYGLNLADPKDNITAGAKIYKQNSINNPFNGLIADAPAAKNEYKDVTKTTRSTETDRSTIFSKFIVNKFSMNFFLKRLQMSPEYRKVTSTNIYDNDGEVLPEAIITAKRKKK